MEEFDYLIIGAGCSGLSLVYEMNKNKLLENKTCAIIDFKKKFSRDKIWSFWKVFNHSFDDCILGEWKRLQIILKDNKVILDCNSTPYQSIDSGKYYEKIFKDIKKNSNIFLYLDEKVIDCVEENGSVNTVCKNKTFKSKIVFNSLSQNLTRKEPTLYQHFLGCELQFKNVNIEEETPILMDFNCSQSENVHFFYCLPTKKNCLFIETTWISKDKQFSEDRYKLEIENYIKENFGLDTNYTLLNKEIGSIPLFHFESKIKNKNIIPIGSAANLTRLSTGYTFLNIQKSSTHLVTKLLNKKKLDNWKISKKYIFFDKIFLKVLIEKKGNMATIFFRLFKNNNNKSIIRFLSNVSSWLDDLRIILSMPKWVFLKNIF